MWEFLAGFRAYGPQVRICQDRGSVWFKAGVLTFGFQDLRLEFRFRFLWLQQGIGWVEGLVRLSGQHPK